MYSILNRDLIIEEFPIINAKEKVIINFVNCDAVMGNSLGNRLKYLFPDMYDSYKYACLKSEQKLTKGKILLWRKTNPWILNMPIKDNWKSEFDYTYLEEGFLKISNIYKQHEINSLAIQEGVIPQQVLEEITSILDLPPINYYQEKTLQQSEEKVE